MNANIMLEVAKEYVKNRQTNLFTTDDFIGYLARLAEVEAKILDEKELKRMQDEEDRWQKRVDALEDEKDDIPF